MRLFRFIAPPLILVIGLVMPLSAQWNNSPSEPGVTITLSASTARGDSTDKKKNQNEDKTRLRERTDAGGQDMFSLEGEFLSSNCQAIPAEIVIGTLDGATTLYLTGEKNRRACIDFTSGGYIKVKVGEKIDELHFNAESFEVEGDNDNSDEELDNND